MTPKPYQPQFSLALTGMLALTIIATAVSILLSLKFYRENR